MNDSQKIRNAGLQNFNLGIDLKKEVKKYKHINWSVFVRKAIEERINHEIKIKEEK